jgi:methylglutaconyl-CoA hydratase
MMENFVLYELNERIAWITLNRPEKRNALSYNFVAELKATINLAIHEPDCKVIVLKSAGETFCSGADLESLQKLQSNTYDENLEDEEDR